MSNVIRREQDIAPALDMRLSGVSASPLLKMRVLSEIKGETKMKKKLSFGLAFAMVLTLLAVGALAAALLTPRQLIDQTGVPMAQENEGVQFTVEETNLLLKLAEENGITLSAQAKASIDKFLASGEGYYEDELFLALAKAEFGDNMGQWSLEEQKWFDDVCVAIGMLKAPEKGLPGEGDITRERAVEIAQAHIAEKFGNTHDLSDPALFRQGVQYIKSDDDAQFSGMYWSIDYTPLTLAGAEYWVYISPSGEVLGATTSGEIGAGATVDSVSYRYRTLYDDDFTKCTPAQLRAFKAAIAQTTDVNNKSKMCIERTEYPDVPENAMTAERAGELAAQALHLSDYVFEGGVLLGDSPNPVWRVRIRDTRASTLNDGAWTLHHVEVDCMTGEIKSTVTPEIDRYRWYLDIVSQRVFEQVDIDLEELIRLTSVG